MNPLPCRTVLSQTLRPLLLIALIALAMPGLACSGLPASPGAAPHHHHAGSMGSATATAPGGPAPFVASSDRPFAVQMMETMALMHEGMDQAPQSGDPDHDFVTMMIPHHQGGIDMAKVLLVLGRDPEMRRLAQAIITDQQNEIQLMQLWLQRHPAGKTPASKESAP